jgi:2-dehydropantoate 2-reductase
VLPQVYNHSVPGIQLSPAHWHVLGAGAMGCLFASQLHSGGHPVTLVLRQASPATTLPVRIEREDSLYELRLPVSAPGDNNPISHLLVTTKAYDVYAAVLALAHRLERNCQVLVLANGMGFADPLQADLPGADFFFGTTTQGAYRIGERHIRHAGHGLTRVGAPTHNDTDQPPSWFGPWSEAVQPSLWDKDIQASLWLKLAINCAINPLTALHRCPNGELARRPELVELVEQLCDELQQISTAAGYAEATRDLHNAVARVIAATADNRSSMLQDVLAGRRTEIDHITGHLCRAAAQYKIEAPANQALLRSILELDH